MNMWKKKQVDLPIFFAQHPPTSSYVFFSKKNITFPGIGSALLLHGDPWRLKRACVVQAQYQSTCEADDFQGKSWVPLGEYLRYLSQHLPPIYGVFFGLYNGCYLGYPPKKYPTFPFEMIYEQADLTLQVCCLLHPREDFAINCWLLLLLADQNSKFCILYLVHPKQHVL